MSARVIPLLRTPEEVVRLPCLICQTPRLHTELGLFTTDLSAEFGMGEGTLIQNVRYCLDNSDCRGGAQTARLLGERVAL